MLVYCRVFLHFSGRRTNGRDRAHVAQAGAVPGKGTALGVRQAWAESWLHTTGWMTLERSHHLFEPYSLICKKGTK